MLQRSVLQKQVVVLTSLSPVPADTVLQPSVVPDGRAKQLLKVTVAAFATAVELKQWVNPLPQVSSDSFLPSHKPPVPTHFLHFKLSAENLKKGLF